MTRLKECRAKYGKKQAEVAKAINVTQNAYSMMESGSRGISSDKLIKLAKFYGCSTDELLGSWFYYEHMAGDSNEE